MSVQKSYQNLPLMSVVESNYQVNQNLTLTQPKIGYLPNQNLVTCNTEYKNKNINTEEERLKGNFEEESLKKGASLCDSHECDSLGIEEAIKEAVKTSDLDDLDSEATKEAIKKEDKISDVNVDSDHKNTQCPATDDEMDPFDDYLDEESEREEAIKKSQRKAEIKSRIEMAKQKNKVSDLDDFDDSDDDFTFTPRKKTHTDSKKEKVKVRRVYGGGMF